MTLTPNHELFVKVLAQIEREPQRWNQRSYAVQASCGTAFCFAGHAAVLCGMQPDFGVNARCFTSEGEPLQTNALTNGWMIDEFAASALGISDFAADWLFESHNTLDDLYRISADILGIDETVLRDKVRAEVEA